MMSGSSSQLRCFLRDNYVTVPDILNSVAIRCYFDLLREAVRCYKEQPRDLQSEYIILTKICTLALERLPSHTSFYSSCNKEWRDWCKNEIGAKCLRALEEVVRKLDEQEDKRIAGGPLIDLIDEFDGEDTRELQGNVQPLIITSNPEKSATTTTLILEDQVMGAVHENNKSNPKSSMSWKSALQVLTEPIESYHEDNIVSQPDPRDEFASTQNQSIDQILPCIQDIKTIDSISGVTEEDLVVMKYIESLDKFHIPSPTQSIFSLEFGGMRVNFIKDDFHISFMPFLRRLPADMQVCRSANEANRCFFLHLGVALRLHPFALQLAFRHLTSCVLSKSTSEMEKIVLPSVQEYAGFVDANSLRFLWPREMNRFRICVISGSCKAPIFTCFAQKDHVCFIFCCSRLLSINFTLPLLFLFLLL